jgi:hypothetical protein
LQNLTTITDPDLLIYEQSHNEIMALRCVCQESYSHESSCQT